MTDIGGNFKFLTIEEAKVVCDSRNDFEVDLKMQRFIYPGFSAEPSILDYKETAEFSKLIEEFAYFYRYGMTYMMTSSYERYLCSHLPDDYMDFCFNDSLYDSYFKVIYFNKLSYKIYHKDILYVFDDGYILVSIDKGVCSKLRSLRRIK